MYVGFMPATLQRFVKIKRLLGEGKRTSANDNVVKLFFSQVQKEAVQVYSFLNKKTIHAQPHSSYFFPKYLRRQIKILMTAVKRALYSSGRFRPRNNNTMPWTG